jgi:gamma-glutamylputrescine oxidase
VRAGKVVICTNAYTGSIAAPPAPRAKVVRNYMVATQPLDSEAVRRLGDWRTFMVELNTSYVFYRLHAGRLVYGGIETFFRTPKSDLEVPASIHKALERHLAKSVPWCRNLEIATEWGGAFHSTATDLPIIQRATGAGSIVFNVGYGGTGVALTGIFAPQAAVMALNLPLPDEDARLGEIVRGTGVPLRGLLQLGTGVAWDVAKGLVLGKA